LKISPLVANQMISRTVPDQKALILKYFSDTPAEIDEIK